MECNKWLLLNCKLTGNGVERKVEEVQQMAWDQQQNLGTFKDSHGAQSLPTEPPSAPLNDEFEESRGHPDTSVKKKKNQSHILHVGSR